MSSATASLHLVGNPDPDVTLSNIDAEFVLLGGAMMNNDIIDRACDHIAPEDFSVALHGRIWAALVRERSAGRHAGVIALKGYFEHDPDAIAVGGLGYLAKMTADGMGLVIPTKDLVGQIRDLAVRRRMRAGLADAAAACGDLERTVAEIASAADAVVHAPVMAAARHQNIGDAVSNLLRSFDEPNNGVTCVIIPSLDKLLGRLRPGTVNVLAGRPAMGKTTVALNYARGAAQLGVGVQYFSLEMSAEDLAGKSVAELCYDLAAEDRVPHVAIEHRNPTRRQRENIMRAQQHLASLPLTIVDEGSMTIGKIRSMVRSEKRRMAAHDTELKLVVVDYLQLVNPDRQVRSTVEAVSEVSRGLKAIAMDEQVAVLALAQLSRAVEQRPDKRPQLSDLRESGQIEQDADAVLFLLREEAYLINSEPEGGSDAHDKWQADMERVRGVIEFILAKKRLGSIGTAFGRFYGIYQAVR